MKHPSLVLPPLTPGLRVRLERIRRRLRQEDVAKAAGVPPVLVSLLERDRHVYPAARRRILAALGLEAKP